MEKLDCKGQACPLPVVNAKKALAGMGEGVLEVVVDNKTAMHNLEKLYEDCQKKGIQLIFSHVNEQPWHVMEKDGFIEKVGADNFCSHIDDALKRAEQL